MKNRKSSETDPACSLETTEYNLDAGKCQKSALSISITIIVHEIHTEINIPVLHFQVHYGNFSMIPLKFLSITYLISIYELKFNFTNIYLAYHKIMVYSIDFCKYLAFLTFKFIITSIIDFYS